MKRRIFYRLMLAICLLAGLALPIMKPKSALAMPTTISIYSSTSDGFNLAYSTDTSAGQYSGIRTQASANVTYTNPVAVGQLKGDFFEVMRGYLYFDTSVIPIGANVTAATLKLYGEEDDSTADFNIVVQTATNATYPHDPLQAGDYDYNQYTGNGGQLNTSSFVVGAYNSISLNATGMSYIVSGNWTKLILRSDNDINAVQPTTNEYVRCNSSNNGNSATWPQLIITYDTGNIVRTSGVAAIGANYAVLQGTLLTTNISGTVYSYASVSFDYGTDNSTYGKRTVEQQVTTTGLFNSQNTPVEQLIWGTTYHFRAVARFSNGTSDFYFYGDDNVFTTLPAPNSNTDLIIKSVGVFTSYIEPNDTLFTVEAINNYTNFYPSKKPGQYFRVELYDTTNTNLLAASILQNWGDRPASIYSNNVTSNYTFGSQYYVRITGQLPTSTVYTSYQIQASDWHGYDLTYLDYWCQATAINMGQYDTISVAGVTIKTVSYLDRNTTINDDGAPFFIAGIPGIMQVRPYLFSSSQSSPVLTAGTANNVWDKTDADPTGWRSYVGTSVSSDVDKWALPFGITGKDFAAGMIGVAVLGVMLLVTAGTGGAGAVGALLIAFPLVWLGVYFRIVSMTIVTTAILIFSALAIRQFLVKTL